jgi:hypothetical protein
VSSGANFIIDLMTYKNDFEKEHADVIDRNAFYMIPTPPEHIISKRCKDSCLRTTGVVCKKCMDSLFYGEVRSVFNHIKYTLTKKEKAYDGGQAVLDVLDKVLEANKKDLPFSDDIDHISQIRQTKLQADLQQFSTTILKIQPEDKHKNIFSSLEDMPLYYIGEDEAQTLKEADRSRK